MPRSPSLLLVFTLLAGVGGVFAANAPELVDREPMVIKGEKGRKIEFVRIGKPNSLILRNCEDITVFCSEFRSVRLGNCKNISIQNSWIHDSAEPGIVAEGCENVVVEGCRIERVATGLYALDSTKIRFMGNYVEDVVGPMPRGQMVQFDKVSGPLNLIAGNYAVNFRGRSKPEDMISIYQSNGDAKFPIVIENNYLMGDPVAGSEDKSDSGSGIMLGDGGGTNIVCQWNTLISPGQVGIGIAGGSDIKVICNTVIGDRSNVSNVGIYAWNQSEKPAGVVAVHSNWVSWTNKKGEMNSWWSGGGFAEIKRGEDVVKSRPDPLPAPPSKAPMPPGPAREADGSVLLPWGTKENPR